MTDKIEMTMGISASTWVPQFKFKNGDKVSIIDVEAMQDQRAMQGDAAVEKQLLNRIAEDLGVTTEEVMQTALDFAAKQISDSVKF